MGFMCHVALGASILGSFVDSLAPLLFAQTFLYMRAPWSMTTLTRGSSQICCGFYIHKPTRLAVSSGMTWQTLWVSWFSSVRQVIEALGVRSLGLRLK
jgi:hypothetical protein